jgi:hypothetical protein
MNDLSWGRFAYSAGYYAMAEKPFRNAAENGSAEAQGKLALMYAQGKGVTQDYVEAAKWLREAAEQGDGLAMFYLGDMHRQGQGVTRNSVEAVHWYRKGAEAGNVSAQNSLGIMLISGDGVFLDPIEAANEAAKWFRKAAEAGHSNAQFLLGRQYMFGQGVPQDLGLMLMWFNVSEKSADPADSHSRERVASIKKGAVASMRPAQIADAQRRADVCLKSNYKDCD